MALTIYQKTNMVANVSRGLNVDYMYFFHKLIIQILSKIIDLIDHV